MPESGSTAPPFTDRIRLPLVFDAPGLQRDLARFAKGDWLDHFVKQNYEGDWRVIPLRGPAGAEHPVMMMYSDPTCTEFADTPFLERCPEIRRALASFDCPLKTVRLMGLTPGSAILEHRDYDLSAEEGTVRLHVPVVTNPDVEFRLNGTPVAMREGECWYLRLSDPHSVANRGAADRVHLVLDADVNAWLRGMLTRGA